MQFKVPQNIDMADKIIGPLTLIQFSYLLVGGIVDYFIFTVVAPINQGLFLLLVLPISVFALAMAFLKIQDQPFPHFVVAFVHYLIRPKMRIWDRQGIDHEVIDMAPVVVKKEEVPPHKVINKSELDKLIDVLDTGARSAHFDERMQPRATRVTPSASRANLPNRRPSVDTMRRPHGKSA